MGRVAKRDEIIVVRVDGVDRCFMGDRLRRNGDVFSMIVRPRKGGDEWEIPNYLTEMSPNTKVEDERPPVTKTGHSPDAPLDQRINAALALLDHGNDDHWTEKGYPSVAIVSDLAGEPVSRSAIQNCQPTLVRVQDA